MKRTIKRLTLTIVMMLSVIIMSAQQVLFHATSTVNNEFTLGDSLEIPNSLHYLGAPPAPWSKEFFEDLYWYWETKKIRDTERGQEAIRHANLSIENLCQLWSEVAGVEISESNTPELVKLICMSKECAGTWGCKHAKEFWQRLRPYQLMREHSLTPNDERFLDTNGSFPSGHSAIYSLIGEILCEIDPEHEDHYRSAAANFAKSRIICGCHYMSDVKAGITVGQHVFKAYLMHHEVFLAHLEKVKQEWQGLKQNVTMLKDEEWEAGVVIPDHLVSEEMGLGGRAFTTIHLNQSLLQRMTGKSIPKGAEVDIENLRYLRLLHVNQEGETVTGEMICHAYIADDLLSIFKQLYESRYPIARMVLIDNYDANDEASMRDNNSSCFCYRAINNGSGKLSAHSQGLAIDINPRYNPCVRMRDGELQVEPANGIDFVDRSKVFPYKIDEKDLAYRLFTQHGFTWGGKWTSLKDYQHFEKPIPQRSKLPHGVE